MSPSPLASDLTVAYSSLAHRAASITPPVMDGVEVLACVQGLDETAGLDLPPGIHRVVPVPGRGVARSRNAAIRATTTRYLLFCDDDVQVRVEEVLAGVSYLRRTGAAIALGRGIDPHGRLRKRYPSDRPAPLTLLNSGKAATYEMLVDVEQVRAAGVWFDERFGAGADTYLGDEYLFIADALDEGLAGVALPLVYGVHPESSSGSRWGGKDLHVRAVVLNHVFGRVAPAARLVFALRRREQFGSASAMVRFMGNGARLPDEPGQRLTRRVRPSSLFPGVVRVPDSLRRRARSQDLGAGSAAPDRHDVLV